MHLMALCPNIVLVLADDMGYGDIGAFGNPDVDTPALDHLADGGVMLRHHYAGSPVCAPSRAALMTGRYPHRTGAIDTLEGRGLDRLALDEVTLADSLKAAGYATGLVGKWHLGALDRRYHPNSRGFDHFVGFRGGWQDYWRWRLDVSDGCMSADGRYLTDVLTEHAVQFIEQCDSRPFFLHVTYNAPHFPLQAPDDDVAPFREKGTFTDAVSTIYAMNRRMDAGVGRILETLERRGLAQNTIVLFTSDNGPQFGGEGGGCTTRFNSDWNGSKGNVYEGGIRVPAILRWPARLAGGASTDAFVHFTDWLPTLLGAVGCEPPRDVMLDGQDVTGAIADGTASTHCQRFWQWNRYTPVPTCNAAVRDGDWKLIRPVIRQAMVVSDADLAMDRLLKEEPGAIGEICRDAEPARVVPDPPAPLLFNLVDDPHERRDVAADHPQKVAQMQRDIDRWFADVSAGRWGG